MTAVLCACCGDWCVLADEDAEDLRRWLDGGGRVACEECGGQEVTFHEVAA